MIVYFINIPLCWNSLAFQKFRDDMASLSPSPAAGNPAISRKKPGAMALCLGQVPSVNAWSPQGV